MARKIEVTILGNSADLERAFSRASRSAQGFNRSMNQAGRGALSASVGFRGLGRSLAFASGAFLGGAGLISAVRGAVGEFQQSARVTAQTNAVLKSTGGIANVTAKQIDALAQSLLNKTGVDDEAIRSGQNVLLTFTKVRNEVGKGNDVFTQATEAALDMSVALGTDLQAAILQVGKALNDPVRGLTALRRAGVQLTKDQEAQIKTLVETGNVLEAQKIILGELRTEFGGAAQAAGQASLNFNVFKETVRNIAADIVQRYAPAINDARDRLTAWVQDTRNQERVINAAKDVIDAFVSVVKGLIPVFRTAADVIRKFSQAVGGATDAVKLLAAAFLTIKFANIIGGLTGVGTAARTSSGRVAGLRGQLSRLAGIGAITIPILLATDESTRPRRGAPTAEDVRSFQGSGLRPPQEWARQNPELARMFPDLFPGLGPRRSPIRDASDRVRLAARSFGLFGSSSAGRLPLPPPIARGLDSFLPRDVRLALASARTEPQQREAFGKELTAINKALRGRLAFDDKLALEQEKTAILAALESMNRAEVKARESGAQKIADAQKKAADAQRKAQERLRAQFKDPVASGFLGAPGVRGAVTGALRILRERQTAQEQAAQFRALGLSATGETLPPGLQALRRQALKLGDAIKGTVLDTSKTRGILAGVRKVLRGELGAVGTEMRETVKRIIDDLNSQLAPDKAGGLNQIRQLSSRRLAAQLSAGLGLSGDQLRALRFNVSGANLTSAGGRIDVHSTSVLNVDGREMARVTAKQDARTAHRTARQTTGFRG